jgi:hypothetical protein
MKWLEKLNGAANAGYVSAKKNAGSSYVFNGQVFESTEIHLKRLQTLLEIFQGSQKALQEAKAELELTGKPSYALHLINKVLFSIESGVIPLD